MRTLKLSLAAGIFGLAACAFAPEPSAQPLATRLGEPAQSGVRQAQATPSKPATPPASTTPSAPATPSPTVNTRSPDQEYKECLALWEPATHMTRAEWAATCRRVQSRLNEVTGQSTSSGRRRAR